ncbi:MAG: ATP-binding protein [Aquabacterium sp.]|nr:ATP-binding protein [Aquabacterium sp.]
MLLLLLALLLGLLWAAVFLQMRRDEDVARNEAALHLGNLDLAFAGDVTATLQAADQIIRTVRQEVRRSGGGFRLAAAVQRGEAIDARFAQVAIIDARGMLVDSSLPFSPVDLSDRAHFKVHQQSQRDVLYVSAPVLGRVSKKLSLQITRRISLDDGSFGGVVVVSLDADLLTNFYRNVKLGVDGVIMLAGADGVVLSRRPALPQASADNGVVGPAHAEALRMRVGAVWANSPADGVDRLYAFRALDDYGLFVYVARSRQDILQQVQQLRWVYVGASLLFSLALLGLGWALFARMAVQARLVDQLRASHLQATAANAMKSRFLASVSHELRTPLNGILGYAELIREGGTDQEMREYAQVVLESGHHLHNLVNTILDLARIEAGQMSMVLMDVVLADLLNDACDMHRVTAQKRGLSLVLQIAPDCPAQLRTDRTRLLQVLSNLIHNALKFTDLGGVQVDARLANKSLQIEVSDTGRGIAPNQLPLVFMRFQAAAEFSHPAQGAGLGLPLAKELTELIGGSLSIQSTPGLGTRVTMLLPLQQAEPGIGPRP